MFLNELLLLLMFFLKVFILVMAILAIVAGTLALTLKNKLKNKEKLKIKSLNDHYEGLEKAINSVILAKEEQKQKQKEWKKNKKAEKIKEASSIQRIFILTFLGDIKASRVQSLREEITAILEIARPAKDTVLVKLESMGGLVHGYGLAASELLRIRNKGIPLVVSVDKVAASGGYMMACVANHIIAAPFAVIGSIGVVAQLPNFHQLLKKHHVNYEQITAGEYKRTLTLFGENTEQGRQKVQDEVNDTHELFKEFISQNRPQVDLSLVATGEHWFATRALQLKLVDQLMTSDEYLSNTRKEAKLFEVTYSKPKKMTDKIFEKTQLLLAKF